MMRFPWMIFFLPGRECFDVYQALSGIDFHDPQIPIPAPNTVINSTLKIGKDLNYTIAFFSLAHQQTCSRFQDMATKNGYNIGMF